MEQSILDRMIAYYTLATQMRVRGGNDYIDFVKSILDASCNNKYSSEKYDFKLYSDYSKFVQDMYKKESEEGLTRKVAGYAWPWISKEDKFLKEKYFHFSL